MTAIFFPRALLAWIVFMLFSSLAHADYAATPDEMNMCRTTIYNDPRADKRDPNWGHMHHYCDCVRFTNRAYGIPANKKQDIAATLNDAIDGCNYVIGHTTPDFVLLPDIYLQKGIIYTLQGNAILAAAEYTKAMNGNPKLAKAYTGLAEFFLKSNDKKHALEIVTKGLLNNPNSKPLKRMYKELGGPMPYPAPIAPVAETPHVQAQESAAGTPAVPPKEPHPEANGAVANTPVAETHEIGSPKNPWCRFCTDTLPAPEATTPSTPGVIPKASK